MHRLLWIWLITAGALASAVIAVGAQEGSIGIRLVDVPAERQDDPRAQVYVIDHLAPGEQITRRVRVTNDSPQEREVSLYTGGAEIVDGRWTVWSDRDQNELASWTSVAPTELVLAPGEESLVEATVEVPPDAVEGERYGVIWAEVVTSGGQVRLASRVGVRMYLSVGEGGEPASDFEIRSLTAHRDEDGRPGVAAEVVNTGGRALDLRGELELRDGPGGLTAGPFPAELGTTLAIGAAAPVQVWLDPAIPSGPWLAVLALSSGTEERTVSAMITFPRDAATEAPPVEATPFHERWEIVLPVAVAALVLALLGLLWALFRLGHARRLFRRGRAAA